MGDERKARSAKSKGEIQSRRRGISIEPKTRSWSSAGRSGRGGRAIRGGHQWFCGRSDAESPRGRGLLRPGPVALCKPKPSPWDSNCGVVGANPVRSRSWRPFNTCHPSPFTAIARCHFFGRRHFPIQVYPTGGSMPQGAQIS